MPSGLTITDNIDSTMSNPMGGLSTDPESRKRWARARAGVTRAKSAHTPSQEALRRKAKRKPPASVK